MRMSSRLRRLGGCSSRGCSEQATLARDHPCVGGGRVARGSHVRARGEGPRGRRTYPSTVCIGERTLSLRPVLGSTTERYLSLALCHVAKRTGTQSLRPVLWPVEEGPCPSALCRCAQERETQSLRRVLWCTWEGNLSIQLVLMRLGVGSLSLRPVLWT